MHGGQILSKAPQAWHGVTAIVNPQTPPGIMQIRRNGQIVGAVQDGPRTAIVSSRENDRHCDSPLVQQITLADLTG
jgi:hypothetical protein